MPLQAKSMDICQTCIHVAECAHHRNCESQGKSVFDCENFDIQPALHIVEGEIPSGEKCNPKTSKPTLAYVEGRMTGLCINCEKRVACRFPTRDGGVWHCEEYC